MRLLLYNWAPFNNPARGSGVTIYLKNVVDEFLLNYPDVEICFLCSGVYYDVEDRSLRYEELKLAGYDKCKAYAIINSPIFAPAYLSFAQVGDVLYNRESEKILDQFIREQGPFDAVHFHNVEGLAVNALRCRKHYTKTKFVFTIHNYYAFCPQVNMWKHTGESCGDDNTGEQCVKCMTDHVPAEKLRQKMAMTYTLFKNYSPELEEKFKIRGKRLDKEYRNEEKRPLTKSETDMMGECLKKYREIFVGTLNEFMDTILAVSNRVMEIAVEKGIRKDKIRVSYIGTRAADFAKKSCNHIDSDAILSVIFMGYQRHDKGFFFLMDVLNKIDKETAEKIDLTIAARGNEKCEKLWKLDTEKFHSYTFKNGYVRNEIPDLLRDKNLGIVPALWEDNLPQIAIEMAANGTPVLCSDMGGAKELCTNPLFCFPAGDTPACIKRIKYFADNPQDLDLYYDCLRGLTTMKDHIKELLEVYQ